MSNKKNPLWDSGIVGKLGNQINLPNFPKLPIYPNLPNLPKIIYSILKEYKTIKQISEDINIDLINVSRSICRNDRATGLLFDGLVEERTINGKSHYGATKKGFEHIFDIIKTEEEKEKKIFEERNDLERKEANAKFQIKTFISFFEENKIKAKDNIINIDFFELSKYSLELSESLLEHAEEVIKSAKLAYSEINEIENNEIDIIFHNLPKSQKLSIGQLRSEHIGKLVSIKGTVSMLSDVRPQITSAKFECPSCATEFDVLQSDSSFKEPSRCGCGRKGKFRLLSKELVDAQGLVLEEMPEDLHDRVEPKKINVLLKRHLTTYNIQPYFESSDTIEVIGILKEVPIILRTGFKSTRLDLIVEANNIVFEYKKEESLTKEDLEQINKIAKLPKEKREQILVGSFAPSLYGLQIEKLGMLISMVSGGNSTSEERDDSHTLLVGDGGKGKSAMMLAGKKIYPKARWISGKSVSAVGLIGSVVKDEFLRGYTIKKGALPMANNEIVLCDELDKLHEKERDGLHEPMENQIVAIDKANKHAKFKTDCTVICAMNPKNSKFDRYNSKFNQINLPSTLIDRFDLIFAFVDYQDEKEDEKLAKQVLDNYNTKRQSKDLISEETLSKYITYARLIRPKLTKECNMLIAKEYVELRKLTSTESSTYIGTRTLKALARLTLACAKLRLSNITNKEDVQTAINLLRYSLTQLDLIKS